VTTLSLRLTADERRLIEEAAKEKGWKAANFLRVSALERAAQVLNLSRPTSFDFSGAAKRFAQASLAPRGVLVVDEVFDLHGPFGEGMIEFTGSVETRLADVEIREIRPAPLTREEVDKFEASMRLGGAEFAAELIVECRRLGNVANDPNLPPPIDPRIAVTASTRRTVSQPVDGPAEPVETVEREETAKTPETIETPARTVKPAKATPITADTQTEAAVTIKTSVTLPRHGIHAPGTGYDRVSYRAPGQPNAVLPRSWFGVPMKGRSKAFDREPLTLTLSVTPVEGGGTLTLRKGDNMGQAGPNWSYSLAGQGESAQINAAIFALPGLTPVAPALLYTAEPLPGLADAR